MHGQVNKMIAKPDCYQVDYDQISNTILGIRKLDNRQDTRDVTSGSHHPPLAAMALITHQATAHWQHKTF
jgi:hypothetical protein